MQLCRFWTFIVSTTLVRLSNSLTYHFMDDGSSLINTLNFYERKRTNVSKLIIDFERPYYLDIIAVENKSGVVSEFTMYALYHWRTSGPLKTRLTYEENLGYEFREVTSIVMIEGKSLEQTRFNFQGFYTNFEKFVGCFSMNTSSLKKLSTLPNCVSECQTFFYGVSLEKNCLCIDDTRKLVPAELNACNDGIYNESEFLAYGGVNHVSVFMRMKETHFLHKDNIWECIYFEGICPNCSDGRTGLNCEIINCDIDNGNCGDKQCQTHSFHCTNCQCKECTMTFALCTCKKGFYIDSSMECKDTDECENNPCGPHATCINNLGCYYCECAFGYYKGNLDICHEIDECANATCEDNESCTDLIGTYKCDCKDDFIRKAGICEKIDDCINVTCGQFETCVDMVSSYSCDCSEGFMKVGGKGLCIDEDECISNPCLNNSVCENVLGGFTCACGKGYYETLEKFCADIDECNQTTTCDVSTTECVNEPGDYYCNCKEGFDRKDSRQRRSKCEDVDECLPPSKCPSRITCINLVGSYDCLCPNGSKKVKYFHSTACHDIDECLDVGSCDVITSFCINTITSYVCVCRPGYSRVDNFTCIIKTKSEMNTANDLEESSYTQVPESHDQRRYGTYVIALLISLILGLTSAYFAMSKVKLSSPGASTLSRTS